jgi:hypothetical protein
LFASPLWKTHPAASSRGKNCDGYKGIMNTKLIATISDQQLLRDLRTAAASERQATAQLIALLAEMDIRKLYLAEGYSSLFTYCTQSLHLSEHAAYGRIEAARAARKFPVVLGC